MIRIGIIGLGHLGNIHIQQLLQISDFQVVGLFDIDPNTAIAAAEKYNIPRYTTFGNLLKDCDAIDIVSPTDTHYKFASKAIKNNKHVFIEKPLCQTLREGRELLKLEQEAHNLRIQIGHVERFNPAFIASKPYLEQPMFIECHRLASYNVRGTEVSVVLDLMIHDLDLILHIVQQPIKKVMANGVKVISSSVDIANARIEFVNGCVANITASRLSTKAMRKMRLFQHNAYLSMDFLEKKAEWVKLKNENCENALPLNTKDGTKYLQIGMPTVNPQNAIKEELQQFAESIIQNKETTVTLQDGYQAMELAYQIIDKIQRNTV